MGFKEAASKATEPLVVELEATLEDGKRAAIKCRPLISIDYFGMTSSGFDAIPILTGKRDSGEMDTAERMKMYSWMREVVTKSTVAIRDIENGESVWIPVKCVLEDMDEIQSTNGHMVMSVRIIEALNGGEIVDVANAIIQRTNHSKEMESAKRRVR